MSGGIPIRGKFGPLIEVAALGVTVIMLATFAIAVTGFFFLAAVFFIQQAMELL